jgi:cytidylate kinase
MHLNGENVEYVIRDLVVAEKVSDVAAIKEVRKFAVDQQQLMGKKKGVIMDGRDIGTVVFPKAELKIFLTADNAVRVERRFKELFEKIPTLRSRRSKQTLKCGIILTVTGKKVRFEKPRMPFWWITRT